jgi:hypothetical protein
LAIIIQQNHKKLNPMKKSLGEKIWSLYQKLNSSVVGRCLSLLLELALSAICAYLCYKWLVDNFVELLIACGFMAFFGVIIWIAALVVGVCFLCLPIYYFGYHIMLLSKKGTC